MKRHPDTYSQLRQLVWSVLAIFILLLACDKLPEFTPAFIPSADFDEQESTMLCWNEKHKSTLLPLIASITKMDDAVLFYNENNNRRQDIEVDLLNARINIEHITLIPFRLEKDNIWIRDYGPSFLRDEMGETVIVGFNYPHLEMKDYTDFTEQFSDKMKIPFYKSSLYSAGGGREINGRGTIILVENYEKEINPGRTPAEIEAEYKQRYNQKKIIWLKKGIPQDDFFGHGPVLDNIYPYGACGHVDEFCRFANPNTILLAEVDSIDRQRDRIYEIIHERLEENYQILTQSTDQNDQPFNIVRVPQASVIFAPGQLDSMDIFYTPVTSYLNFVITNHSVIIPSYYQAGDPDFILEKDQQAIQIFKQVFPTREVQTVDATKLNYDGGGLHCVTLPTPRKALKPKLKSKRRMG